MKPDDLTQIELTIEEDGPQGDPPWWRRPRKLRRQLAGTLVAAFLLLPAMGLQRTVWVGVATNALVFAVAVLRFVSEALLPLILPLLLVAAVAIAWHFWKPPRQPRE